MTTLENWLTLPHALAAIRDEQTKRDFQSWLHHVTPAWSWQWRHLVYINRHLELITAGEIARLIIEVPPRHGKSEMVTIRYPVWRIKRTPALRVIIGAYNQTLASKFSRKARRIAEQQFELNEERTAVEDWETTAGGGMRAVGVGGGITGQGGDLIVVDDPVKNREEANSPTYRDRVWYWWRDDLYTRLEPGGAMILIMTRWHEDDLAGRILASEDGPNWTEIKLPAEAEKNDPLGREEGEALCPDRYDKADLERIRMVLGNSYYALYQQRPQPAEGGMFKREWFKMVPAAPQEAEFVRYWDKAGTEGGGDYTAGVLMARTEDGLFCVVDVVRGRWSSMMRENVIRQTAEMDRERYGKAVQTWVEQEPGSGGKESAQATIRNLAGFNVRADRPTGSKEVRAEPLAAQAEAGNVKLVTGRWNQAYLDELTVFPSGKHKDQVDASSGAFNKLAAGVKRKAKTIARW